jgi:hypothetical protein
MNISKYIVQASLIVVTVFLLGCDPEQLVVWTADGKTAAVLGREGLRLCDESGKLSEVLIRGAYQCAWIGDSRRAVVSVHEADVTWADVEGRLGQVLRDATVERGLRALALLDGFNGSVEALLEQVLKESGEETDEAKNSLLLYLRDQHDQEMSRAFGDAWVRLKANSIEVLALRTYDLADGKVEVGPDIAVAFSMIKDLRPAPGGKAIAFTVVHNQHVDLRVASLDGKRPPHTLAKGTSASVDWSPDGRSLLYAQAHSSEANGERVRSGSIRRTEVLDESGALRQPSALPRPGGEEGQELAVVAFTPLSRVRWLKDGRVVFNTFEMSLPAVEHDSPQRLTLFVMEVKDGRSVRVTRLSPRRADDELPTGISTFEVSPDQKRIAVAGGGFYCGVLGLDSGEYVTVQEAAGKDSLRAIPSWRTGQELWFAKPGDGQGQPKRPAEVAVWRVGDNAAPRVVSADWPQDVVAAFKAEQPK